MTLYQWFLFFLIIQVVHFIGTWKLYEKAGRKSWEAAIPVYNAIVLMKIINRPAWWTILLFIPIINLIMFPVVWVETIRSFGKKTTLDTVLVLLTFGLYIYYINYTQDVTHIKDRSLVSPTKTGDTVSSLLFAIVVATLVHTYVMQPFTIPTSSLEKTLLVGDFLFVSKFHYGARTPMTTVALPMVHDSIPMVPKLSDSIPFLNRRSYLRKPQLPYFRFPGFEDIEKNDIVVFNWPADTVYKFFDKSGRRATKPLDKRSNYVKRCVATPGDVLSIKDGLVFIDGKELKLSDRAKPQYTYLATYDKNTPLDFEFILKDVGVTDGAGFRDANRDTLIISALTFEGAEKLKSIPGIKSVSRYIDKSKGDFSIFPHNKNWTSDNYGPITIPAEGATVELNKENLPMYQRIIEVYENNDLKVNGDEIRINGAIAKSYTFKQDYYWMMGDNRHRSEDSRYWGFVPADHIVGKPVFIWMSLDQNIGWNKAIDKIRWDRMFTTVGGDGEPYSYFKFFLIALAAYFGINYFIKKKKAKN